MFRSLKKVFKTTEKLKKNHFIIATLLLRKAEVNLKVSENLTVKDKYVGIK